MPKLVLFKKHLNVGSDDFVFSGSLEILVRCIGLIVILVEFVRYLHDFECSSGHLVHTYLTGLMVFHALTVVVDYLIVRVSMRGTMIDDSPRKNIGTFLYTRLMVLVTEFFWTIYGTASIVLLMPVCDSQPRVYWLACAAVALGWLILVIQGVLINVAFNFSSGGSKAIISKHDWEKRWKGLFCCLSSDENRHIFSTLSRLCMQIFKKEEELVASDILAGLILVYHKQHQTRQQLDVVDAPLLTSRIRCKPHKTVPSPSTSRKPWMTFSEAAHFMKYALGSYGWFYFIGLNNPVVATCKLLPKLNWSMKEYPPQIEKDGKLLANTAAFHLQTGCSVNDLVCASFLNEIYAIPFYVCIDNESESVVVAVRGTLSLEDILTDLVVERAPVCFGGVEGFVHTGMFQSAKYIRNKLISECILEKAFQRAEGYRLVITGHSLGAGVAALLALELRPSFPDLICFAFATPGELVSDSLLPYTEEFVCTVALGYDVVPRLGLVEAAQLRIDILDAIKNCTIPKHQVIAGRWWTKLFGKADLEHLPSVYTNLQNAQWFDAYIQEETMEKEKVITDFEPLYPPGQILHVLEKKDHKRAWNVMPEYYAEWTDCQTFREIVLSKRMIAHHFPDTLLYALRQLAEHDHPNLKKEN
ncbi:diacylglycerol lipase-beta-like [Mercenaria mercenaria]|uniref:diacylglycerol lipase-beta-like n=1 Tax=Mercenaria mercenaria TaxID=6596 RepID=UPI00234F2E53|nr:diacylglycerol lipase-beta-like [Mercenaria mercenaria]XP_053393216.1 diacylglycerol lipase-beta-like [Mercenaria mercenaria]